MYRRRGEEIEFLLVHPGGPFFARKDEGAWTIPKGEAAPDEDLLSRARIEFAEELGFKPTGDYLPLGSIKQKGGKRVHAWAFAGELPHGFRLRSNRFELEWPPRSGKRRSFPEIDRAKLFQSAPARKKINGAQLPFLDRLCSALGCAPADS
jgi:predicted NUDIX family NTP pyrophosphohydrolase